MVRTSVPASSKWTANACRSECGVIGLGIRSDLVSLLACVFDGVSADRLAGHIAREEPVPSGRIHSPPAAQDLQQSWGEHHVAILLALALLDANDHPLAVDVGGLQSERPRRCANPRRSRWSGSRDAWMLATQARNWRTSSGLRTTGNFCGFFGAGMTSSKVQSFLRETL